MNKPNSASDSTTPESHRDGLDGALAAAFGRTHPADHEPADDLTVPFCADPHSPPVSPDVMENRSGCTAAPASGIVPSYPCEAERYRIVGEIGRGGIGVILQACDSSLGRDLAIKVLREEHQDNPALIDRFIEEAQISGQLEHPGIIPVHETGQFPDGRPYFTMKLVKGQTLATMLESTSFSDQDRLPLLKIFEQVCQTIAYAHCRGVVHRDLKPANIMLGPFGEIHVMDWGLAKILPDQNGQEAPADGHGGSEHAVRTLRTDVPGSESAFGCVIGTPGYMSPEQARGAVDQVDKRTDVFGLGAILCQILTGKPPYARRSEVEAVSPESPGALAEAWERLDASGADPALTRLAKACLAVEPQARPKDARVVAHTMTTYLSALDQRLRASELAGVEARAVAAQERRARRLTISLAASVIALGFVLGGVGIWIQHGRLARLDTALQSLQEAKILRERATTAAPTDPAPWGEARVAAEHARILLDSAGARSELMQQALDLLAELEAGEKEARSAAEQGKKDQDMVERLADIRLQRSEVKKGVFDFEGADSAFSSLFREYGIDLDVLSIEEAAACIRKSKIALNLVAGLDDWALARKRAGRHGESWRDLLEIAQAAETDAAHADIRSLIMRGNQDALKELAVKEGADLPVPSQCLLAQFLAETGDWDVTISFLRQAQRRHPEDFWINSSLANSIKFGKPQLKDDIVRFYSIAAAVNERSAAARDNLGNALGDKGAWDEAIAAYEDAIRLKPGFAEAHLNLGNALQEKGRLEDAIRAYREAIRLRPDFPAAYYDLASAIDEKGDLAGAAAAYEEAIRLRPGYAFAYVNLGIVRAQQGDIDRAIACFEEAIRLEAKNARFYCNLAGALGDRGDLDEAAKALEQALKLAPDYAMAFYNLGTIRERQGRFSEALDAYRRSHELGSRERNWRYPSAERMRVCERFVDLEKRLPAILAGEASPAGAVERARLGQICLKGRHLYHASAQFFEQAFSDLPSIVEDFRNGCRYDAACAAALGAYGQGNDAVELTDEERSRWRAQARRWLEADLACWDKCLESGTPAARAEVILNLRRWQSDPKLSPVRDKNRIAELPAVERDAWGDVWKRVDGLLARARQK